MQSKVKTMRARASNIKLHAGGGIRFGFMRQNNISGRTLSVTDVCSYVFDADSFASYQLRDDDTDINMIIAEGDRPEDSYLALSLPLKEKWFTSLFPTTPPREWLRLKAGGTMTVATDAVVMPQGWLVSRYNHVLTTRGRKIDGDFRQRKLSDLADTNRDSFEYVLLVSENGEHAIELEKYDNGSIKAYATVYRPMSDISETTQFHRPYIVAKNPVEPKPQEDETAEAPTTESFASTLMLVTTNTATAGEPEASVKSKPASEATITELVESALAEVQLADILPILKTGAELTPTASNDDNAPQAVTAKQPEHMLACDTQLVARIIEEAGRNKFSLEQIIRKILDLPAEFNDNVYVPFALTAKEQTVLAKRYGTKHDDITAIQQHIVEELRQFAGLD